ncbi:MAG: sodium/proton-translocating pyrophosphatase, partial [Acidipropionibacterium acidipropionici]|nr:sodium/proton-translocating pyrophosphatase [Acidipropionibacterium acidipropionici]
SVVGDTVGDPFKDTSSVALNPVIKFTTLFGLLAVELAVSIGTGLVTHILAAVFFVVAAYFVYRSFYGMRIHPGDSDGLEDPDIDLTAPSATATAADLPVPPVSQESPDSPASPTSPDTVSRQTHRAGTV